jgi:hypothetical protein
MVRLLNFGTRDHIRLKRLLLCGTGWLVACIAQTASAQVPAELTDLSATITAPAFVNRGEPISVSLKVTNAGPNEAAFVSARLELGAGLNMAIIKLSGGTSTPTPGAIGSCIDTGNTLSCRLPQLPSGESFTFDIVTAPTTAGGSFAHIAVVESSGTDLILSNNSASAATTVTEVRQDFVVGGSNGGGGGGGGGSLSLFMIAALLVLSGIRVVTNKFPRPARRPLS